MGVKIDDIVKSDDVISQLANLMSVFKPICCLQAQQVVGPCLAYTVSIIG